MKLWQIFDRKEPKFWEKIDILTELLLATWLAVKYQLVGLESWLMRVGMCFLPFLLGLLLSFGRNGTVRMKTCLVGRHHLLISYYRKSRHFHYYETFFFFCLFNLWRSCPRNQLITFNWTRIKLSSIGHHYLKFNEWLSNFLSLNSSSNYNINQWINYQFRLSGIELENWENWSLSKWCDTSWAMW